MPQTTRPARTEAERSLDPLVLRQFLAAAGDVVLMNAAEASHPLPRSTPVPTVYAYQREGERWCYVPVKVADLADRPAPAGADVRAAMKAHMSAGGP